MNNDFCKKCSLFGSKRVFGFGNINSDFWIIGEAPGETETLRGKPFVGQSGLLLRKILDSFGIKENNIYITNTIKCRPPNNREPTNSEILLCKRFLDEELAIHTPKVILTLGKISSSIFVNIGESFGLVRGTINKINNDCYVIPSWHPTYILRNYKNFDELEKDIKLAYDIYLGIFNFEYLNFNHKLINDVNTFVEFSNSLCESKVSFAFDIESTGLVPNKDKIIGVSFSSDETLGYYLPLRVIKQGIFEESSLVEFWNKEEWELIIFSLTKLLQSDNVKAAHNAEFELKMLRADLGIIPKNVFIDTMLISNLLDENQEGFSLFFLQNKYLSYLPKYKTMIKKYIKKDSFDRVNYAFIPLNILAEYCAKDSIICYRLAKILVPKLEEDKDLYNFYINFSIPLMQCLSSIEEKGIYLDLQKSISLKDELSFQVDLISKDIYKIAGKVFNINSDDDLRDLLFNKLKLPVVKKTLKGQISVDKYVMSELASKHDICKKILEYRKYSKLISTYIVTKESSVYEVMDSNGYIHASFRQIGTKTGRLSCENPNLENLPARSSNSIKKLYTPRPSIQGPRIFIKGDYSQMELRMLAFYSKDKRLLNACSNNIDLHTQVASDIFGIPLESVTPIQRSIGKGTNFSVIYGQHFTNTAKMLNISDKESKEFQDKYFSLYSGILNFKREVISYLNKHGFVRNCFGRIRHLPDIYSDDLGIKSKAERQAVNSIIQGSSVDFCNYNMSRLNEYLLSNYLEAYVVLQVHDEVVVECYEKDSEKVFEDYVGIMQSEVLPVDVFMKIDAKFSKSLAGE